MIKLVHPYDPNKIYTHQEHLSRLKQGELIPPVTVDIDLTDVCNHKCPCCEYAKFRIKKPNILNLEIVLKLLNDLSNTAVKGLIFSGGGEPTLHPHFERITNKLLQHGFNAALYTHGEYIDRHIDSISKAFSYVRVSLDAGSAKTYSIHHKSETSVYNSILNNLKRLKRLNPKIKTGVSVIITENNYSELKNLCLLIDEFLVDYLLLKFSRFDKDNKWVKTSILKIIKARVAELNLSLPVYYRQLTKEDEIYPVKKCCTHYLKTLVAPDGNIYICNQHRGDPTMTFGSLYEKSFWDIWNGIKHRLVDEQIDTNKCPPCRHIAYNKLFKVVDNGYIPEIKVSERVGNLNLFL